MDGWTDAPDEEDKTQEGAGTFLLLQRLYTQRTARRTSGKLGIVCSKAQILLLHATEATHCHADLL